MALDAVGDCVKHKNAKHRQTLVIQGTEDTTVPPAVSAEFVDAMRKHDVPVELHTIEDADHGFSRRVWQVEMIGTAEDWLGRML